MSLIIYAKKHNIATITLNDPDRLNAMNVAMGREFSKIMEGLKKDREVRVVILTGAGKAFSSGGNLDMLEEKLKKSKAVNKRELKDFYKMYLKVRDIPQPVIAAINGSAVGAGFCLALACDLRLVARSAKLGANFARIGLAPGMGGTFLITRLAGVVNAAEILFTGKIFSADKAKEYGIVNTVCEDSELMSQVETLATEIAQNGPLAVSYIKKGIQQALTKNLVQMFDYDAACQAACFAASDIKEGIKAIRKKRAPRF